MNVFDKQVWLLDLISRKKRITFEEIANEWRDCDLNVGGEPLVDRTFRRWCTSIESTFNLDIECDRSTLEYYIDNVGSQETVDWMIHSSTIGQVLSSYRDLRERIVLDRMPAGEQHLIPIMDAMRKNYMLHIIYQSFDEHAEARDLGIVKPLCVRLYNQIWYAVVEYATLSESMASLSNGPKEGDRRVLALDRILTLEQTNQHFKMPKNFNAEQYFAFDYGVAVGFDEKPCIIRLKANAQQAKYLRAMPFHSSQKETETNEQYSIFEYFLKPSYDLARAILPWANKIEVLQPDSLRHKLISMAFNIINNNKKD